MDRNPLPNVRPVEVYLLRHGETAWNAEGRFQGKLDSPLTARGIAQAEACGALLAASVPTADRFVSSPLGRTQQTADILRRFANYPATEWESRLAEVSIGAWDGLTDVDIDALWPGHLHGAGPFNWYFRAPDGERFDEASARARDWLQSLSGITIAVSHGLIGRLIRGAYLDLDEAETLSLPVPQDTIWHLKDGIITPIV